jgi:hypothetical protein
MLLNQLRIKKMGYKYTGLNITDEILEWVDRHNASCKKGRELACEATGGGCDFVVKYLPNDKTMILSSAQDFGSTPDELMEAACITIYDNWQECPEEGWTVINYFTTMEALLAMATAEAWPNKKQAAINKLIFEYSGFMNSMNYSMCIKQKNPGDAEDLLIDLQKNHPSHWAIHYLKGFIKRWDEVQGNE